MSLRGGCAGQRPVTGEASAPAGDSTASARGQGSGQPPRHAAEGPEPTKLAMALDKLKPRPLLAWAMGLGFFTLSS
jgi:hypothetical protein